MLSNKTYRFIFVILTLREGKRFVSFVPTEVNRSNERQEHLRNLVWFCFTLVLPNKRNELFNQLRKKEMWLRLVNNLLLCCLSPNDCHPSTTHINGFITFNILHPSNAQYVEATMIFVMYCVNFLCLSCALLQRIFS